MTTHELTDRQAAAWASYQRMRARLTGRLNRELARNSGLSEADFEILDIIIDCADPHRLGALWAEVLGRPVDGSKGPYVWLARSPGAIGVGFRKWRSRRWRRIACTLTSPRVTSSARRLGLSNWEVAAFTGTSVVVSRDGRSRGKRVLPHPRRAV